MPQRSDPLLHQSGSPGTSGNAWVFDVHVEHFPRPWWKLPWRWGGWYAWFYTPRGGTGNVIASTRRAMRKRTFEHIRWVCDVPDDIAVAVFWKKAA